MPAVIGTMLDDLRPGPATHWDNANSVRVELASGALSSRPDGAVLNGANVAAIRNPSGDWEVFQFANADLVGERTYRLSRLLRGQLGTESAVAGSVSMGAPFVVLDEALVPIARGLDFLGRSFSYRVGRASDDVASANMTSFEATVSSTALLPWTPAHLQGRRVEDGTRISWIRRERLGGDSWEALEVPLDEPTERYRVEILHDGAPVRVVETEEPRLLYTISEELADFGAPQSELLVRIAQVSAVVGRGRARTATLHL
jgi:hypothetical protein